MLLRRKYRIIFPNHDSTKGKDAKLLAQRMKLDQWA